MTFARVLPQSARLLRRAAGTRGLGALIAAAVAVLSASTRPALAQTGLIRVAQARVDGSDRGEATFNANVVGVIKPWVTPQTAAEFYAYDAPALASFNGR